MKFLLLVLLFINIVPIFCEAEYECKNFVEFLKTGGYKIRDDCCNEPGIECRNDSIFSITLTLEPGVLDFNSFPKFSNLDKLSIKGDVYQGKLPIKYFNTKIRVLDISNSKIKTVPWNIVFNFSLEELYLNDNEIESFPYIFSELLSLKILNLDNNKISGTLDVNIPTGTNDYAFYGLKKLSLQNNQMEGKLIYPGTLKYLNIQNNTFSSLKNNNRRNSLREIDISNNLFSNAVFDQLKFQTHIKRLKMRNNKNISSINENIIKLSDLEYLDLSDNNLKSIHNNLFKLTNLKHLDISDNPKLRIRINNFEGKNQVKTCNFTNTNILCYEPGTCENIKNTYTACRRYDSIMIMQFFAFMILYVVVLYIIKVMVIRCANEEQRYSFLPPPEYTFIPGYNVNTPLLSQGVNNYNTINDNDDDILPSYEEAVRSDSHYEY